jgi:rhodanese-related sulfurtransferase
VIVSYAGDLDPTDSYRLLADDPASVLVDVRTAAEWNYVGLPDLSSIGKQVIRLEWLTFPGSAVNSAFVDELQRAGVAKDAPVLFLCRSGQRSMAAATAATNAGYTRAYNIAEGFEGGLDAAGHRGGDSGWKALGLPWRQS